ANADEAARARGAPQRPSEPDDSGDSHENHDGPADEYSHLGTNGGEEETQLTSES
ncbi:MAG: hypothetical protein JKX69_15655, partial [Rhodobacteraceae bacterium]|nr:hypothetical protein [Paracoccaceae bacterium]